MPNLRNGSKGGFEPGLTRLRVRHSTAELPRSKTKENPHTEKGADGIGQPQLEPITKTIIEKRLKWYRHVERTDEGQGHVLRRILDATSARKETERKTDNHRAEKITRSVLTAIVQCVDCSDAWRIQNAYIDSGATWGMCSFSRLHVFYKTLCGFCCYFLISHCLAGFCLYVSFSTAFLGSLQAIVICPAHLTRRFTIVHLCKPQLQSFIFDITMRVYPYLHASVRPNPVNHICLCLLYQTHHQLPPDTQTTCTYENNRHSERSHPIVFRSFNPSSLNVLLTFSHALYAYLSRTLTHMHRSTCLIYLSSSLVFSLFSNSRDFGAIYARVQTLFREQFL